MRIRKFRVWDKAHKRMYYPTTDLFIEWDKNYGSKLLCEISSLKGDSACSDTDYEIMDFLPLKDKYGQGIYEGDILSASRTVAGLPLTNGKVAEIFGNIPKETRTWNEILVVELKINENSISFVLPEEGGTYQERGKKLKWEIIGNIYQNPDLIPQAT